MGGGTEVRRGKEELSEGGQRREAPPGAVGIPTISMELANRRRR